MFSLATGGRVIYNTEAHLVSLTVHRRQRRAGKPEQEDQPVLAFFFILFCSFVTMYEKTFKLLLIVVVALEIGMC